MIKVVFNPYTESLLEENKAKEYILSVANKVFLLKKNISESTDCLSGIIGENLDSLNAYIVLKKENERYNLSSLIHEFHGKDRVIVTLFFTLFSKGQILSDEEQNNYRELLDDHELPAPLICYAAKNNGVVVTISDDEYWNCDFFTINNQQHKALNISYNLNEKILKQWCDKWRCDNLNFITKVQEDFKITICKGAINSLPSSNFHNLLYENIKKAYERNFVCTNKFIKRITNYSFFEIRIFGNDNIRIFFMMKDNRAFIGGFYFKNEAISQEKSIQKANKIFIENNLL